MESTFNLEHLLSPRDAKKLGVKKTSTSFKRQNSLPTAPRAVREAMEREQKAKEPDDDPDEFKLVQIGTSSSSSDKIDADIDLSQPFNLIDISSGKVTVVGKDDEVDPEDSLSPENFPTLDSSAAAGTSTSPSRLTSGNRFGLLRQLSDDSESTLSRSHEHWTQSSDVRIDNMTPETRERNERLCRERLEREKKIREEHLLKKEHLKRRFSPNEVWKQRRDSSRDVSEDEDEDEDDDYESMYESTYRSCHESSYYNSDDDN